MWCCILSLSNQWGSRHWIGRPLGRLFGFSSGYTVFMNLGRVFVYVAGFNLYYSLDHLGVRHLKWLDLWSLSEKLIREKEKVVAVKYFTAYATWRESSLRRHQRYVAAPETCGVEVVRGRFKVKTVRTQAECRQEYNTHEEKETNVNIGVHLMADACQDRFDRALVISADTDLNSAVTLVLKETNNKKIDIVAPPKCKNRNSRALFEIAKGKVADSLLPEVIKLPDGNKIVRPNVYRPPD